MDIEHALNEVKDMAARVAEAVDGVAAAKQALQLTALKVLVACEADSEAERDLVSRLYWEVPDLPVKTLEAAVGSNARVRELAGTGPVFGTCADCGVERRAKSRTELAGRAWPSSDRCDACRRRREAEERARMEAAWAQEHTVPPEWYEELDDLLEEEWGHRRPPPLRSPADNLFD